MDLGKQRASFYGPVKNGISFWISAEPHGGVCPFLAY